MRDQSQRSGVVRPGLKPPRLTGIPQRALRQAAAQSFAQKRTKESGVSVFCHRCCVRITELYCRVSAATGMAGIITSSAVPAEASLVRVHSRSGPVWPGLQCVLTRDRGAGPAQNVHRVRLRSLEFWDDRACYLACCKELKAANYSRVGSQAD